MNFVFKQGGDKKITIEIVEVPLVDFSTATEIICITKVAGVEAKKYSLTTKTGYGDITIDTSTNKLIIYVEREDSVSFGTGLFTCNIIAQFPNIDFPDGNEVKTYATTLGRVLAGTDLDEIL